MENNPIIKFLVSLLVEHPMKLSIALALGIIASLGEDPSPEALSAAVGFLIFVVIFFTVWSRGDKFF